MCCGVKHAASGRIISKQQAPVENLNYLKRSLFRASPKHTSTRTTNVHEHARVAVSTRMRAMCVLVFSQKREHVNDDPERRALAQPWQHIPARARRVGVARLTHHARAHDTSDVRNEVVR